MIHFVLLSFKHREACILFEGSINVHLNIVLSVKTASDDLDVMNVIIYMVSVHILALKFFLSAEFQPFLESSFEQVYGLCDVSC